MYSLFLKRCLDLIIATTVFIILSPVFIIITIALYIINKQQPFFKQLRPGLDEKIFTLYKYRTMSNSIGANGQLLPDAQRITVAGKFLRKTSLDELPQLINVIKGDMSLIGPRPLLPRYLPYYSDTERLRHQIRPGITGWAQVNGRNVSNWDDRLAADVYYYNNLSFKLDVVIIYKTIKSVFSAKDIIVDQDSYMDPLDIERSGRSKRGTLEV
jgi:undecaprenyl phosphate N,N'-diacetylbacillosamine 1-phosphate transferase